jgi:hypothetical protein
MGEKFIYYKGRKIKDDEFRVMSYELRVPSERL